jgi:tRNA (guanine-N7-)-methyltransferase
LPPESSSQPPGAAPDARHRPIRSFVRRAGRMTRAQERALEELWPRFGVHCGPGPLDFPALFGRRAPVVVEVGFGNGDSLVALAARHPGTDFLGIEVHEPGVGHCLLGIEARQLTNLRVLCQDAVEVLRDHVADGSLAGVNLFFPDPWPKKRHHKRRIVQPPFVDLVSRKLAPGGRFQVATDWPEYAEHIRQTVAGCALLAPAAGPVDRDSTRFEARGQRLGHPIWEGVWKRV